MKSFEADGEWKNFVGKVISRDGRYYTIQYCDGDSEQLNANEVLQILRDEYE
jgi:hypothetical protein